MILDEKNNQEIQQKYMEMQMIDQQLQAISQHLANFDNQLSEINDTKKALDDLSKVEEGSETLVTIASGIFAKAKITDVKNLKVNVGGNVVVEKDVESTKKLLDNQMSEVERAKGQLLSQFEQLSQKNMGLQETLKDLS